MKELVTLRKKPMKQGESLFLDYSVDGVRHKEYLKMYLVPEKTRLDKIQNQETLKTALTIKAQRTIDVQNGIAGVNKRIDKCKLLADYIDERVEWYDKRGSHSYSQSLIKVKHLIPGNLRLCDVDPQWLKSFLLSLSKYKPTTQTTYFALLVSVLNSAVRDELIPSNPASKVARSDKPKATSVEREFLTLDEVRMLIGTDCRSMVKPMFLFSCFTGLRLIDIETLRWSDIKEKEGGVEINKVQVKTKSMVVIPLTQNALEWLPKRHKGATNVFRTFNRRALTDILDSWVKRAGIKKHITFHCARHTYATLLLTYGADIYTVSRLLGHQKVATTEIYAKIVDKKRREAVDMIPSLG